MGLQDDAYVLNLFDTKGSTGRRRYRQFVINGLAQGNRNDLVSGGINRRSGGWSAVKSSRKASIHTKSDERILGDSDFVETVLKASDESFERRYHLRSKGFDLEKRGNHVAELLSINPEQIFQPGKQPYKVRARSLFAFWATSKIGAPQSILSQKLGLEPSAIGLSVSRGRELVEKYKYVIETE